MMNRNDILAGVETAALISVSRAQAHTHQLAARSRYQW